jgi:uncharacterized protein YcbX
MRVLELRRYPVKAMGGESLQSVRLDARGLEGDRWFAVETFHGTLITIFPRVRCRDA